MSERAKTWARRKFLNATAPLFYSFVAFPVLSRAYACSLITARQYHLLNFHFNPANPASAVSMVCRGQHLPMTLAPVERWLQDGALPTIHRSRYQGYHS